MNAADYIAKQRTQALDAAAAALEHRDRAVEMLNASWEALEQCILSGQVPQEDVPQLVASVPGFADWRQKKG
jgi:hypothetical protein